ncbi:hypothetical protein FLGE108171_00585 [Flavobacterium gelidilacus]|uniref:hypothetical protein n=1 Tax=Flavobacterium gelidilacus TaxID=206041 RepID=UPI0004267AF1|nr:hypothetical protein [Flavobacterium gelidilacus]
MKKLSVILASLAIFASVSCKESQDEATVVEKETVIIEKEAAPAVEENDGTSISVNSDGVEFSTKDGDKKTEVEVKDGSGTVKVEK